MNLILIAVKALLLRVKHVKLLQKVSILSLEPYKLRRFIKARTMYQQLVIMQIIIFHLSLTILTTNW